MYLSFWGAFHLLSEIGNPECEENNQMLIESLFATNPDPIIQYDKKI